MNQDGVGVSVEKGLGIADRNFVIVHFLGDAIAVLDEGLSDSGEAFESEGLFGCDRLFEGLKGLGFEGMDRKLNWG